MGKKASVSVNIGGTCGRGKRASRKIDREGLREILVLTRDWGYWQV